MRKLILAILLLISFYIMSAQPVRLFGQLRVQGTQLTDQNGNPIVLRGMSFGWHNYWPRFYNAEAVAWLHNDWKVSILRAAMGVEPAHGYLQDPGGSKAKVRAVVDAAIKEGIYVIIDWHCHNIQLNAAKEFFTEMALTYGKTPNVIYELFNEPDYESWPEVKQYSIELIKTIRAIDPDNIILVGNPHWDQDINLVADDPITGFDNIMYTMHFYAATHKQELRDKTDYALKKGIPVFISECAGMEATGNGPIDNNEWMRWINWAEKNKLSWITWSIADKDETCSVLKKGVASTGGWKEEDLKESGIKTRALLRKYNSNQ